ncbi:MAG: Murein DD-endopeptidase MepH [Pseudomonas sp.]|nr:MAG: Murein DD-endopeptidase MepH [Pseudomonas sp.]
MLKSFLCLCALGFSLAIAPASANIQPPVSFAKPASIHTLIERAHSLLGTPYKLGGSSVSQGFDCSSFLVYLFRTEAGIQLPRTTAAMHRSTAATIKRTALQPGDAVFFKGNGRAAVSHVGLYIGDNRFIHSPRTGKNIRIDSLANNYWSKNYIAAKRFH